MSDTIVAPATPGGRGGVSIVRLSGKKAADIGRKLCGDLDEPWKFKRCNILDLDRVEIDSGLVVLFKSPKSYTGEDVLEIHCHGNPVLINKIIGASVSCGARMARPGEFTERAFLNNKIDLAQAESVSDLILAQSTEATKAALSSLKGDFSIKINSTIDRLTLLRVRLEASLDFPDEEVEEQTVLEMIASLKKEISLLSALLESSERGSLLREGFKVSIIGPPNSGKSTLLNLLSQEEASIVTNEPGTTRDPIKRVINLLGYKVEFVDTAGLRTGIGDVVEKKGMEKALLEAQDSDIVLSIKEFGSFDEQNSFSGPQLNLITKCDLDVEKKVGVIKNNIYVSAKEGLGIDVLVAEIFLALNVKESSEAPVFARKRHVENLGACLSCFKTSLKGLENKEGLELVSESLKEGQLFLGEITRPVSSDDLLGEIFSHFCIGK